MFKVIKRLLLIVVVLALGGTAIVYGVLTLSLPTLDGKGRSDAVTQPVKVARDTLGQAVITAVTRHDAAYGLGYAHGQDRFFQMDLLRRNAAGELSELFGKAALALDKKMRFHQLRKRSQTILKTLPQADKQLLKSYAQGVNEGLAQVGYPSFEYLLTGAEQQPWQSEDSLLVIFSMYLDLQTATFERDQALIQIQQQYGAKMVEFLTQPSQYQAALDGSILTPYSQTIPQLPTQPLAAIKSITANLEVGSNNWAVTADLTNTQAAMLSDDMHLSMAVPVIWYRAQLNYTHNNQAYQVTGVSLPGAPAIVVGSNNKIAWGFTNGYIDTADWVALTDSSKTWQVNEVITLDNGNDEIYPLTLSEYGPVKYINNQPYALSWAAHQPYAVDMQLLQLEQAETVDDALNIASNVGIPVQNLMVVDSQGSAAWKHMGGIPARTVPSELAINENEYAATWQQNEVIRPFVKNPESGRLWTGNSRVVSAEDNARFGNGGYALGARATQIRDRLFEKQQFNEGDFYQLQLDNQARFLTPWHSLLLEQLKQQPEHYADYINALDNWQQCACSTSVGYTLVKTYRDELINILFSSIEASLNQQDGTLSYVKRDLEPAVWQLIKAQPASWVNPQFTNWEQQLQAAFEQTLTQLTAKFGNNIQNWQWGKVNELAIEHPFAKQIPLLSKLLNMPTAPGFGDSYMPAVQKTSFGASQRFIAQPGYLESAILTVPGGQSGHPLSEFYRAGFDEYVEGKHTPLLPQTFMHQIEIVPIND
ncbi:penicillin acylase family protein [Pseudoalteromonas sp. Scap03]|uniref:penicillin acylase family protein n=1 Tax=unclassified Pseudoalteromonas TaxID=194690 RepID=UPI0015C156ED|nr:MULTISPECIES: penicillin acylase family protein [unclassified Pseudoalteromonas]NWL14962.1 penicillin acylase family protein [Pseudoalteromonas sp. Scap03]QLE80094.1 penicillin acylase family protein [Pseudoalteromonas sp. Scap25]QLE88036.1 penicillin acylase family protein [Pseudoalteromonas sp. Scap06]